MDKDSKLLELLDLKKLDDMAPGLKDYQKIVKQLEQLFPARNQYTINRQIDETTRFDSKDRQAIMEAFFKKIVDESENASGNPQFDEFSAETSMPYQRCERNESIYESRIIRLINSSMIDGRKKVVYAISFNPANQLEKSDLNADNLVAIVTPEGIYKVERADYSVSDTNITLEEITDEAIQEEICKELARAIEALSTVREPGIDPELYNKDLEELKTEHSTIYYILYRANVRSLGELVACTENELRRLPGFGQGSLAKVKAFLESQDLSLRTE